MKPKKQVKQKQSKELMCCMEERKKIKTLSSVQKQLLKQEMECKSQQKTKGSRKDINLSFIKSFR